MSLFNTLIDEVIDEWYTVRKGFIAEVKNIPPSRFTFRPTLESRSALEIVQHVLENGIMTTEELLKEETNYHRTSHDKLVSMYSNTVSPADTKEKLIDLLVQQFRDSEHRFKKSGELFMLQAVTMYDGTRKTRLSILNNTISHEMYHRGQLALAARLLGIEPAMTRELRMGGHIPSSIPTSSDDI